jgi:hypothetical protein
MAKYIVLGTTNVLVSVEVTAKDEDEAYKKAAKLRRSLSEYAGNGGTDKLIGVYGEGQEVFAVEDIVYDDIEVIGT